MDAADAALESMIAALTSDGDLPVADDALQGALDAVGRVDSLLHEHLITDGRHFVGDAASLYSQVRDARTALWEGEHLATSGLTRAASDEMLLLTGRAGVGKTHLFCDVASRRLAAGRPTVLVLGQDFDNRPLLTQLGGLAQLPGTTDDVLSVLNAAGEAAGCVGLLMIDALNESDSAERWRDEIPVLLTVAARYPHVAVVLSCRSEFVEPVVGEPDVVSVEHVGFAEATDVAVRRFTEEYGLEPPTFPVLNPEFSNPLFLRLTCEALESLGQERFPFGEAGLTTVCEAFLEAVNQRLAAPARCDFDARRNLVGKAVRALAGLGGGPMGRADATAVVDALLPGVLFSRSLMRGLLAEGVLIELSGDRVAFGYQRLGDVVRAESVVIGTVEDVATWYAGLGDNPWAERGVLGALAVIVPERFGVELLEVVADEEGRVLSWMVDGFLESLLLRSPGAVTERAVTAVEKILAERDYRSDVAWDRLVRVACVPGHALNAEWLHAHLSEYDLADRDLSWSNWLVGAMDADEAGVRRLIEWAWPVDLHSRRPVPDDVVVLVTLVLGWLLTTPDRQVRDRATKALVSLGERAPAAFAEAMGKFRRVNDPYVMERLTAAACGVALRTWQVRAAAVVASGVRELVADGMPEHLWVRDFARRTSEVAVFLGWDGDVAAPPYGSDWPVTTRPVEEIEEMSGPPDYAYGSVWHSLKGLGGDFGRYVMQPALRDVVTDDATELRHQVERAVFDRVLELGWTPERFGEIDQGRHGGHDGQVERFGKKYQWIALSEMLGRITDHHQVKAQWGTEAPAPYSYAEQLMWRDIDPTVLVRELQTPARAGRPWFTPTPARFPDEVTNDYPTDMTGVPDPLDVLAVTDEAGQSWLTLCANPTWEQDLPPEVAALEVPRRAMRFHIRSFLTAVDTVEDVIGWLRGRGWADTSIPSAAEPASVLLGAHPDDPEWAGADGLIDWWGPDQFHPPADLFDCAAYYGGTGTGRDASASEEVRGCVPTRKLHDILKLGRGVDFTWTTSAPDGEPDGSSVQDPSVTLAGPSSLLVRRDLMTKLAENELTIVWTVDVNSELHERSYGPRDNYQWVGASVSYALSGNRIDLVDVTAAHYRPGPTVEAELTWGIRESDD